MVQMLTVTDHVRHRPCTYVVSQNKLTTIYVALAVVLKGIKGSKREQRNRKRERDRVREREKKRKITT
jgi:hypothetical protein